MKTLKRFLTEASNSTGLWVSFNNKADTDKAEKIFEDESDFYIEDRTDTKLFFSEDPNSFDSLEKVLIDFMNKAKIKHREIEGQE